MAGQPDPQLAREIAREATQRAARRRDHIGSVLSEHAIMDEILASRDRSAYRRWCDAIKAEMQSAAVTVSWPDEQTQERCSCGCLKVGDGCDCRFCNEPYPVVIATDFRNVSEDDVRKWREAFEAQNGQARAERDADAQAVPAGHGPGVPGAMHLEAFGQTIADAFGECPYHVGSSATSKTWRDVDVRLILDDDRFHALFPGFAAANHIDAFWSLLCAALSELGKARTGLPIDFQIQSMTEANTKYNGIRNPLFLIRARDEHRPVMTTGAAELDVREGGGAQ